MKKQNILLLPVLVALALSSCNRKSYFTMATRANLENNNVELKKIQYYIDKDVELKREMTSGDVKVTSGKVKLENGKYVHIIYLKKHTPGVCTSYTNSHLDISFEIGDDKVLTFSTPKSKSSYDAYQITADEWNSSYGKITYEGKEFYIQPGGSNAKLMIKKKVANKSEVKKRKMKGRKL